MMLFTQNYTIESFRYLGLMFPLIYQTVERRYLKEYRCPSCNKLLSKGHLSTKDSYLEVKCRGCNTICLFEGEDKEIIQTRAELIKGGVITGYELSKDNDESKQG